MPRAKRRSQETTEIKPVIEELAKKYDLVPASEIPDPKLPSFDEKEQNGKPFEVVPYPQEPLPSFPIKLREPFPPLPQGFEARGTFEAAGVRVNRHGDGSTALQFKDGARMSFEEKLAAQDKGYSYDPARKQWPNPDATWEQKVEDAREMAEARLKDRER